MHSQTNEQALEAAIQETLSGDYHRKDQGTGSQCEYRRGI